ncbi:hypothetical protein L249_7468 [Ophiocordyceps polyrhachis-furcata BCC 54312]|uniref:Tetrapyrrole biosynthesis uroporphyrinogen III synthase domain-containing protein n=1 Tax=Ophiocordyceps polyrhachis-furcata BCC 54312 TaxID=1330021 RepID=A0A367LAA2_9HYPO|nr:hypothetical protein L249_7468 [Ophiocordyceps polyrhachis-furcata BCC 54312]
MASPPPQDARTAVAILLKTPSSPRDPYEEQFQSSNLSPYFVPVLRHQSCVDACSRLEELLLRRRIGDGPDCLFGGLIVTSQRAVEALASVVEAGRHRRRHGAEVDEAVPSSPSSKSWPHLDDVPVFAVGPATAKALKNIAPMCVLGGVECGNGESLARYIQARYRVSHGRPLLFLVGEQRRDVIPRTLMDDSLPPARRIQVIEEVVYTTTVVPDLVQDLDLALRRSADSPVRWIVVFSPSGCDSLLRSLGWIDEATGKAWPPASMTTNGGTLIVTIGPTTRAHLMDTFDFEPHACAATPSPEGVLKAIEQYMRHEVARSP